MILMLKDRGWLVMTNAWTVASKHPTGNVTVCYSWGADQVGIFAASTGIAQVGLGMDMANFTAFINRSDKLCDLREWCE